MSFFEPLPEPRPAPEIREELDRVAPEWIGPPQHVVGGRVPFRGSFVHDDRLCIRIDRIEAYPMGLALQLELHLAHDLPDGRHISGWFPWAVHDSRGPAHRMHRDDRVAPDDLLRFGVPYHDGRLVATGTIEQFENQHRADARADRPPAHPVVVDGGGSGGGQRASVRLWLWPFPPVGEDLVVLIQWPVFGIREATVTIPGETLAEGLRDVEELWPDDGFDEGGFGSG